MGYEIPEDHHGSTPGAIEKARKDNAEYFAKLGVEEYLRARKKFPPFNSTHEGYAVILEELDEMWDDIKTNDLVSARVEAVQVLAMVISFLIECDHD